MGKLYWAWYDTGTVFCSAGLSQGVSTSPHKESIMQSFGVLVVVRVTKLLNKKLRHWWFEMPWCTCEITLMVQNPPHVLLWCYMVFMRICSNQPRGACRNEYVKYNCSQSHHAKFTPLPMFCCVLLWLAINWFYPFPSGLLQAHWGNHTSVPVPVKQLINNHMIPTKNILQKQSKAQQNSVYNLWDTAAHIYKTSVEFYHNTYKVLENTHNRLISQISQCSYPISHNAYVHISVLNGAMW